jgi:threonine/homoserine/homoserine lactone efflux protein
MVTDGATALVAGLGLGAFVAAQVGPVSLLCVRTSTRSGFLPGWSVGAGAALVDLAYAALGIAGAASVVSFAPVQLALGLVGAVVLLVMGFRTLHAAFRLRLGGETEAEVSRPSAALRTGLVATASNPLTIVSWAAIFGAASTASLVHGPADVVEMLVGVGVGSLAWFTLLAGVAATAGSRLGTGALAAVDVVAGAVLMVFGGALGVRTLREADLSG